MKYQRTLKIGLIIASLFMIGLAQVDENEMRYFRIGSLQSQISSYGSERGWNNIWYEGLRWPADYLKQDNSVIKRAWITCKDFTDAKGQHYDFWAMSIVKAWAKYSLFPITLKQTSKFEIPSIFVEKKQPGFGIFVRCG